MANITPTEKNMLTIKETYKRAAADGVPVSENFIRRSCKTGKLPHLATGKKILIYYPNFVKFVTGGVVAS